MKIRKNVYKKQEHPSKDIELIIKQILELSEDSLSSFLYKTVVVIFYSLVFTR